MGLRVHTDTNIDTSYHDPHYQFTKSEEITLNLMQPYFGKGYHLYTDNYYTSPQLAAYLETKHTHLCGTVKHNRQGMPSQQLNAENLERGQMSHFLHEDKVLLAVKYREAKDRTTGKPKVVHMLTTMHDCSTFDTGRLTRHDPPQQIIKPQCVSKYNVNMGGVDRTDQMLGLRSLCPMRKTLKWYQKLFVRLLLQMQLNAYKLYRRENPNNKRSIRWFAYEVVKSWMRSNLNLQQAAAPPPAVPPPPAPPPRAQDEDAVRLNGKPHMPTSVPKTGGQKKTTAQRNCRVCTARGHRTSTSTMCKTCVAHSTAKSKPGLYIKDCELCQHSLDKNCWEVWHTQKNLLKKV
ncbi:piggyBac transposable element-derived protein 4-like [Lytechinus variegatus]|uniref:piggyBac transposable element-derived protein 4-like n=1 Tax=Lytechinus variegatus TaxID=7654 RepID=UPI001BB0DD09|nr:piggyBac transposable element-derived protein 4-like [Lytechinus variegatus]